MTGTSVVVGAGVTASFLGAGLPMPGSAVYGAAVAILGLVFTAVALVAAQVSEHARGGVGLSIAVFGGFYLVRAAGDVSGNWLTWTSPIGWVQAVRPFAGERWWPLGLALLFAVGCTALAGWLTTRRDIGSGLLTPRRGPADASPSLRGPAALAARLLRGSVIGWSVGLALLGAVFGSLGRDVEDMIEGNPELAEVFARTSGGASVVDAYFATVLTMMALVASGFTVAAVLRLRSEESALRAEPLLATPLGRTRWTAGWLTVVALASLTVLGAGGLGTGITYAWVDGDAGHVPTLLGAALAYLPAALSLGALGFALFGWLPRSTALAWGALAVCVVSGWLGPVLRLPQRVMDLSPYTLTPQLPMESFAGGPLLGIAAAAAALVGFGLLGFRRRDVLPE
jgi:ABC-2 type transport system permease protein